jgi:hypothetical protein
LNVSSVPVTVTVKDTRSSNAGGVDEVLEPGNTSETTSKITPTNEHRAGPHTFAKLRFEGSSVAAMGTSMDLYDHSLRWGPSGVKATVTVDIGAYQQVHLPETLSHALTFFPAILGRCVHCVYF